MVLSDELRQWRIIPERLRHWAKETPEAPFLKCDSDWFSFSEVDEHSDRIAAGLTGLGLTKGDRVAMILPNSMEMLLSFFACSKLGLVQVPMNTFLRGRFLSYQLADAQARIVIADLAGANEVQAIASDLPTVGQVVQAGADADALAEGKKPVVPFTTLSEATGPVPEVELEMADLNALMYTSGTTGMPKGCMLSHGYYMAAIWAWFENDWARADDRIYTAWPLFHTAGQQVALMIALQGGLPICYEPAFSASSFIPNAAAMDATVVYGVGPMGMAILATPPSDSDRDHNIRGGVFPPMPVAAQEEFEQRFGIPVISEGYGQTECNPITMNPWRDEGRKRETLGPPVDYLEVELHDDNDNVVPAGEVGEIVLRPRESEVMFQGYWNNAEATLEASRQLWHHTGDFGVADGDGFITFKDRKRDAMRRRGENVSSIELEGAIIAHPKVTAVAVHGVPSPLGEEDIKACIVPAEGDRPEPAELFEFFKANLPYFAVPRYVELLEALPVNAMGRVLKHELRAAGVGDAWDFEALGMAIAKDERR